MQHSCCALYPPFLLNATPMLHFFGWERNEKAPQRKSLQGLIFTQSGRQE